MIDVNGTSHARYGVRYINTVGPRRETPGALVNSSERGRRRLGFQPCLPEGRVRFLTT